MTTLLWILFVLILLGVVRGGCLFALVVLALICLLS
jgi:hypothetical protein